MRPVPPGATRERQNQQLREKAGEEEARHLWAAAALAALAPAVSHGQTQVLTKEYDNGGVYEGTFVDGHQHGQGTYRLPSGYEYTGDWVEGRIEGQGRATYPNGSVYEGAFVAGRPRGPRPDQPIPTAAATRATGTRAGSRARASPPTPTARATRAASSTASRAARAG